MRGKAVDQRPGVAGLARDGDSTRSYLRRQPNEGCGGPISLSQIAVVLMHAEGILRQDLPVWRRDGGSTVLCRDPY